MYLLFILQIVNLWIAAETDKRQELVSVETFLPNWFDSGIQSDKIDETIKFNTKTYTPPHVQAPLGLKWGN